MDENKNQNEEVKTEVVDNKNTEKKYNEKNLTFSIILAAIILAVCTLHWILEGVAGAAGGFGNLPWLIINIICVAGAACVAVVGGLFFFKVTMNNLKKDIPSFCVSLAAFALATIYSLSWSVDLIKNLIGCIQGNL